MSVRGRNIVKLASEAYLSTVVENQGKLFDFVACSFPLMNTEDFINTYMVSQTRSAIDNSQAHISAMDAPTLWDYFTATENYSLKLAVVKQEQPMRPYWIYVPKTYAVALQPPYNLIVSFDNGERRILNIEKYIDEDPTLRILKKNKKLLFSPKVSLCGYMTVWEAEGIYVEFHNDNVYAFGKEIIGGLGGFLPKWIGEFYAYYQWHYNIPSPEVLWRIPLAEAKQYALEMSRLPIEKAVQNVGVK